MSDITKILVAIIGVAIVAVLVSKGAQTANVLNSFSSAFSNIIKTAVGPVSGGTSV